MEHFTTKPLLPSYILQIQMILSVHVEFQYSKKRNENLKDLRRKFFYIELTLHTLNFPHTEVPSTLLFVQEHNMKAI